MTSTAAVPVPAASSPAGPNTAAGLRLLLVLLSGCLTGCGSKDPAPATTARPAATPFREQILSVESVDGPVRPDFPTARCRIYSSDPQWSVFIDGYPVRDADGRIMQTPCEASASPGAHTVTLARAGKVDQSRQVPFGEQAEVDFLTLDAPAGDSLLLAAPYLNTPAGTAISLNTLNTVGNEFDPFVTPDGLAIYFAGERTEGRGIFTATRPSPLHPFEEPRLLRLTSSSDGAASPSLSFAGTMIVYTLPAKGRLRALTRSSPLSDFAEPQILLSDANLEARYPSAQILAAGDRIYFTRDLQGQTETRVAFAQPQGKEPFGGVQVVQFPGEHPRLSSDGLRQYLYDGRQLRRSRRTAINLPFAGTELVTEVSTPGYIPSEGHRQFCVTDDEQWLFCSDDPLGGGDLWMIRLSNGPAWGAPLTGTSIPPRSIALGSPVASPDSELFLGPDRPTTADAPPPPPDPRRQPLPYVQFRNELSAAAAARDFTRALELIDAAQSDPALQRTGELLEWDRQDVQQLIQFWQEVEGALGRMQPGDKLRLGAITVDFEQYADGVLTTRGRTSTVQKRLAELDAGSIVSLQERSPSAGTPAAKLQAALFLTYSGDRTSGRRGSLLAESGAAGREFQDRLALREASLAEQELARENIAAALDRIERLEREQPQSSAAAKARELRDKLYQRTEWRTVGNRRWTNGPLGEWTAGDNRVEGALLRSPGELERFELLLEYRINSSVGNGGVYFRYSGQGRLDRNALKVQFSNDAGMAPHQFCTGSLFAVQPPRVNAARPLGEWNTLRMSVDGDRLRVRINDQEVLRTQFPTSGLPAAGYVALDGVRGGITYRKIILSDQPLTGE